MKGVYLVLGEEEMDAKEKIASLCFKYHAERPEMRFGFDAEDVARTISDLQTPSLFSSVLFILMSGSEQIPQRSAGLLAKSIVESSFDGAVVFRSEKNRVPKPIESITPEQNRFVFYPMLEAKRPQFVRYAFRKLGFSADDEAVRLLLSLTENNKEAIERACRMVVRSLSGPARTTINENDVSNALDYDKEEDSMELFSCIANRNLKAALMSARMAAISQRSLSATVSFLLSQVRKAASYMRNMRSGRNDKDAWTVHTILGESIVKNLAQKDCIRAFAAHYDLAGCQRAEYILMSFQRVVRSGADSMMQLACFERGVARICSL